MEEEVLPKLLKHRDQEFLTSLGEENIECLRKFEQNNLRYSHFTRDVRLRTLMHLAIEIGQPFNKMTKENLEHYFYRLSTDPKIKVNPYTKETKRIVVVTFFKWLYGIDDRYQKPDIAKGLKHNPRAYTKEIEPSNLLTDAEVKRMVEASESLRDKALVMMLYDSGCRISELLSMNVGHVEFIGDACFIYLPQSKTKPRRVGLIHSVPHLKNLLETHPYRTNKEAPLFLSFREKRLASDSTLFILKRLAKRAGINKNVNNHLFRHISMSNDRARGLKDHFIRQRHGLKKGSNVLERYTWVDDKETYDAYRESNGLDPIEQKRQDAKVFHPIKCLCGAENPYDAKFCYKCRSQLGYETIERDISILEMVRTGFTQLEGIDLEKMMSRYQKYRASIRDIQTVLDCFNGETVITNVVVQTALNLDTDECLEVLQHLMSYNVIELEDDKVILIDRKGFENLIKIYYKYIIDHEDN